MKKVLLLGAGRIAGPFLDYLARKGNCGLIVADQSAKNLATVAKISEKIRTEQIDVTKDVARLIDKYLPDVVTLFLPSELLIGAMRVCVEKNVHMVHPVYMFDEMRSMSDEIKNKGLICIAELGVDPGIDHMSACRTINNIHARGGKIESFRSLCGGLPALDSNTNPWGYKLSWAPATLIGASKRTAKIILDGEEITWADGLTYEHPFFYEVPGLGIYEVYANADATIYRNSYNIPEAKSIYRGTLRYQSWCETICYMNQIGFFNTNIQDTKGLTFGQFTARQCGFPELGAKQAVLKKCNLQQWSAFILRMEWIGFFDDRPLPFESCSARDVVSLLFSEKLNLTDTDRDILILCDETVAEFPGGSKKQFNSILIDYGTPGKWTSLARTTGIPPAIATKLIMDGQIKTPGLHSPTLQEIYEPVLRELETENIIMKESEIDL